jgi:hypothetical protein
MHCFVRRVCFTRFIPDECDFVKFWCLREGVSVFTERSAEAPHPLDEVRGTGHDGGLDDSSPPNTCKEGVRSRVHQVTGKPVELLQE